MDKQATNTATAVLSGILARLQDAKDLNEAKMMAASAASLLQGRCLIREELNGALAVNLATLDFPFQISKDGPTEQDKQTYHDFVGMCREMA